MELILLYTMIGLLYLIFGVLALGVLGMIWVWLCGDILVGELKIRKGRKWE